MPTYYGPAVGGRQLKMDISWTQNVSGNYSTVRTIMSYIGSYAASDNSQVGVVVAQSQQYWYQGSLSLPTGTTVLADVYTQVAHNTNGAQSVTFVGGLVMPFIGVSLSINVNNLTLPTIPRIPSAPTKPVASAFTHNSMTVKFSAQGSIPATAYQLQRATNSAFTTGVTTISSTGTSNITGLTPGTTYYYRARSQSAAGWSAWSSTLTTYTRPQANTPTIDSITATGMRVQFGHTGGASGGVSWELQRATNAAFTLNVVTIASNGTSVISGLQPNTTYYFRAIGSNASGDGPWSGSRSATTLGVGAPSIVVLGDNTGAAAQATITPPTGATATAYTIQAEYLLPLPKPANADKSYFVSNTSPKVTGLIPGATYRWRVQANIGSTYVTAWSAWYTHKQFDPNAIDKEYFDASMTPTNTDLTRSIQTVSGVSIQEEKSVTPAEWSVSQAGAAPLTMRREVGNLVASALSTHMARVRVLRPLGDGVGGVIYLSETGIPVLPSAVYTGVVHLRANMPVTVEAYLEFDVPSVSPEKAVATLVPGETVQLRVTSPTLDVAALLYMVVSVVEAPVGATIDLDGGMVALGRPEGYFDGGTANTARYVHTWEGVQWNSVSLRTTLAEAAAPDPFLDPNCPPLPAAPRPPLPENDCIPDVNTWRRYWSPLSSDEVPEYLDALPVFTVTTGEESAGPIRILMFDNPDNLGAGDFVPGDPISEQVISFMPANSEAVIDAVSERSYGKLVSAEDFRDIDHLVSGAAGGPAVWPTLSCGANYMIAIDVPSSSTLGNINLEASLTTRIG